MRTLTMVRNGTPHSLDKQKNMEEAVKIKFLLIFKNQGSITELLKDGFTYGQIAKFVNDLINEEFIVEKEAKLILSDTAEKWLSDNFKKNKLKGSDSWIVPEEKSKIIKLKENELYLPNRGELHF